MRIYHTLLERINGVWLPQFGDHDKAVVRQERVDMHESYPYPKLKDMRIVSHPETQNQRELAELVNREIL